MKIINSISQYQALTRENELGVTGLVPTMGALHDGHQSLVTRSLKDCDTTVVSIFVNPTQFNKAEDLENYPDTLQQDIDVLKALGCDYLFMPAYADIYPDNFRYHVEETELSKTLCGAHRQGHFTGVLTIVMKLLNIVRPNVAYFGEKDYQQYLLIKDMVKAFFLNVKIISCPTVREQDGLALSSRNLNLDIASREKAPLLHQLLASDKSDCQISAQLVNAGFEVDYVETKSGRRFAAASLGESENQVRLIDNVVANQ